MLKRSLTLLALAGLLSPLSAQDAPEFSYDRPDAMQFGGVLGDRLLPAGAFQIGYTFEQADFDGIQFGSDEVSALEVWNVFGYTVAPFERRDRGHRLQLGYGATDRLTLRGSAMFRDFQRDILTEDLFLARTENNAIGDVELEGMYEAYRTSSIRAHVSLGVELPTGTFDEDGENAFLGTDPSRLTYSMQTGVGSTAIVPGLTLATQNERGTVGVQAKARFRVGENDAGWKAGDEILAKLWAGYRFGDVLALTTGLRVQRFGSIEGFDDTLDPLFDPANDIIISGGTILSVPLGLNVALDRGVFEGTVIAAEFDWPIHQDYDQVRITQQRTLRITISRIFGM